MTADRGYLTPDECRAIEAAVDEVTDDDGQDDRPVDNPPPTP